MANRSTHASRDTVKLLARFFSEQGVTRSELARQLGVSQPLVSAWFNGRASLSQERALALTDLAVARLTQDNTMTTTTQILNARLQPLKEWDRSTKKSGSRKKS